MSTARLTSSKSKGATAAPEGQVVPIRNMFFPLSFELMGPGQVSSLCKGGCCYPSGCNTCWVVLSTLRGRDSVPSTSLAASGYSPPPRLTARCG